MTDYFDQLKGAFVGLAIGDALGTTLEFVPRNKTNSHRDMIGGGPFNMPPGGWTDDTSMALCLADSLLEHGEFNPVDLMNRFANWRDFGYNSHTGACFDIGNTTNDALSKYLGDGDPYAGSTDPQSAGNGSLMRLAPVVLAYARDQDKMLEVARLQSRTTHAAEECEEYCARFAVDLIEAMDGKMFASDLVRDLVSSSGYVKHTYDAAIWAVANTSSFREAVIYAVNLGDDADTVGAVTGQLAGAVYGYSQIPEEWLQVLVWREKIEALADNLIEYQF